MSLELTRFISLDPDPLMLGAQPGLSNMKAPKKPPSGAAAVVGGPLAPLTLPSKAESVVSITSQCSYSSTIVHVGDKKPQPESGEWVQLSFQKVLFRNRVQEHVVCVKACVPKKKSSA